MSKLRYPRRFDFLRRSNLLRRNSAETANSKAPTKNWQFEKLEDRHVMSADPLAVLLEANSPSGGDAQVAASTAPLAPIPTDAFLEFQWHILNTGQIDIGPGLTSITGDTTQPVFGVAGEDANVIGAWQLGFSGEGVTVAVVDSGIQLDHPDLINNLSTTLGFDAINNQVRDPFFFPDAGAANQFDRVDGPHGTAVAGIIAADDNGEGTVGVAFDATLVPVQLLGGPLNIFAPDAVQNTFSFANDEIDIYNLSFGPQGIARDTFVLTPGERDALEFAAEQGRNGLGNIFVVASGNSGGPGVTDAGITDIASNDELINSRFTIAVGGVDHDGESSNVDGTFTSYPEAGASVLIVAPTGSFSQAIGGESTGSGIFTTDFVPTDPNLSDADALLQDGFNGPTLTDPQDIADSPGVGGVGNDIIPDRFPDNSVTSRFNGTSAAAPIVSGVVALLLEANPNLTQRDVQEILVRSARQNAITETIADGLDQGFGIALENTWVVNRGGFFQAPNVLSDAGISFLDLFDNTRGDLAGDFQDSAIGSADTLVFNPIVVPAFGGLTGDGTPLAGSNSLEVSRFSNGSGFTVSQGRGILGTTLGYAHGVVDAELAVRLALQWDELNQNVAEEFSFTTGVQTPNNLPTTGVSIAGTRESNFDDQLQIPGRIDFDGDGGGNEAAISSELFARAPAPGTLEGAEFADDFIPIPVPETVEIQGEEIDNTIVIEYVEVIITNPAFNPDTTRLTLVSPDGTHSELTQFFDIQNGVDPIAQDFNDPINGGTLGSHVNVVGTPQSSTGNVNQEFIFSTNRNWGERSDTSLIIDPATGLPYDNLVERGWELHVEDFGGANNFQEYELIFHGQQISATSRRIQGRIGVDEFRPDEFDIDNDLDTDELVAPDGLFNFDRTIQVAQDIFNASRTFTEDGDPNNAMDQAVEQRIDSSNSTLAVVETTVFDPFVGAFVNQVQTFDVADESVANGELEFNRLGEVERVLDSENIESYASNVVVNLFADVWDEATGTVVESTVPFDRFLTGADGNYYFDVEPPRLQFVDATDPRIDPLSPSFDLSAALAFAEFTDPDTGIQDGEIVQYRVSIDDRFEGRETVGIDFAAVELETDPVTGLAVIDPDTGLPIPVLDATGNTIPRVIGENGEVALPNFQAEWTITSDYFLAEDHRGVSPEFVTIEFQGQELQLFSLIDNDGVPAVLTEIAVLDANGAPVPLLDVNGNPVLDGNGDPLFEMEEVGVTAGFLFNGAAPTFFATDLLRDINGELLPGGELRLDDAGEPIEVDYQSNGQLLFTDVNGDPLLIIQDDLSIGGGAAGVDDLFFFSAVDQTGTPTTNIVFDQGMEPPGTPFVDPNLGISVQLGFGDDAPIGTLVDGVVEILNDDGSMTLITPGGDGFGFTQVEVDAMGVAGDPMVMEGRLDLIAGGDGGAFTTVESDISGMGSFLFAGQGHFSALPIFAAPQVEAFDLSFGETTLFTGGDAGDFTFSSRGTFALNPAIVRTALAQSVVQADGSIGLAPVAHSASGFGGLGGFFGDTVADDADNINFLLRANPAVTDDATFSGTVFTDANGDGELNTGDTPSQGVTVFIDVDRNGELNAGDISTTTDANGEWNLAAPVTNGVGEFFSIRVVEPAGLDLVSPANNSENFLQFAQSGDTTVDLDFVFAADDTGGDGGGADGGGADGGGSDGGGADGGGGDGGGADGGGADGGDGGGDGDAGGDGGDGGGGVGPGAISGFVFEDFNNDGDQDFNEPGVSNVTVFLDENGNGTLDDDEDFRLTSTTGFYQFLSVPPDDYVVQAVIADPFGPTGSVTQSVTVSAGQSLSGVDFGVENLATRDFGDLANFPAASHLLVPGIFLGSSNPDGEVGNQPSADANGDDITGADDEDGVVASFGDQLEPGETFTLTVTVAGIGQVLNGWIDFNGDGVWSASERVFDDKPLTPGTHTLTNRFAGTSDGALLRAPLFGTTVDGGIAARFRWGPALDAPDAPDPNAFAGPSGAGEVEDYLYASIGLFNNSTEVGDFNNDGEVDNDDFEMFANDFGEIDSTTSDANTDGIVNLADFTIWRDNASRSAAVQAATEPDPPAAPAFASEYAVARDTTAPAAVAASVVEEEAPLAALVSAPITVSASVPQALAAAAPTGSAVDVDLALLLLDASSNVDEDEELLTVDAPADEQADGQEDGALALALEQDWFAV